jgi:4a-hydroxytetrahydrobiopterin dehydratase
MNKLTAEEIQQQLRRLHHEWRLHDGRLHRHLRFSDFVEAFGFISQAALIAERMQHHPEWRNSYNIVEVELTTHEAGGLTLKDFTLARAMDEICRRG